MTRFVRISLSRHIVSNALKIALVVGTLLNLVNQEPVGLKGNRLQIHPDGAYFTAFWVNRTTIDLRNQQNLPSPS